VPLTRTQPRVFSSTSPPRSSRCWRRWCALSTASWAPKTSSVRCGRSSSTRW